MSNTKPLEGIRVVELATFIAGPCCTRFLADLGAEVIKVESPKGDQLRYTALNEGRPYGDGEDTSFTLENTGKKSVTLNTKAPRGREALEKLIARAEALRPAPIKEQMAKAAKEAGKENAARPTPAKGKEARDDR